MHDMDFCNHLGYWVVLQILARPTSRQLHFKNFVKIIETMGLSIFEDGYLVGRDLTSFWYCCGLRAAVLFCEAMHCLLMLLDCQ